MGASIEGEKIDVQTRQWDAGRPMLDPKTNKKRYAFRLGIRSSAVISEAYADPANSVSVATSMISEGDEIMGTTIRGWSKKPLGKPNVEKGSGSHSASFLTVKGGCFARVEIPAREILENASLETPVSLQED
ncbi:hypothetical protein [Burkholderia latens]|uniref:hypothetical protein n=1 Tax=Burkholderia latens TaxID=488446 RepID=UPI0012E3EBBB|nr:hypothetical protein [Burkholderia latens]